MFTSTHSPNGEGSTHFDNARLESLIGEYQAKGDAGSLGEIVRLTQTRALTLIRYHKTARYVSEAELLSDVNFKLLRAVNKFDPAKGSAFTFVSRVVVNTLCTAVTNARSASNRFTELRSSVVAALVAETEDRSVVDDIAHMIKAGTRTTLTDPTELSAQRWYIASFLADGFDSRRHECANAAMAVYDVSHERSRELYDLTMLEVRRVMYDNLPPRQPIAVSRLLGTRAQWMIRYRPLLNDAEFTKFVVLVRDLGPFVVVLSDPESHSRRQDRNPTISRLWSRCKHSTGDLPDWRPWTHSE